MKPRAGAPHARQVAVVGPDDGGCSPAQAAAARELGSGLARLGLAVVTGGLGGVMAAASRGAAEAGGLTVGLLPGTDPAAANPWVGVVVPTGLGQARNVLVVRSGRCVVAIGHGWGTLSEIALALRDGIAVIGLGSWRPSPDIGAESPVLSVGSVPEALAAVERL